MDLFNLEALMKVWEAIKRMKKAVTTKKELSRHLNNSFKRNGS